MNEQRLTDLETRQADLEKRIAELEKLAPFWPKNSAPAPHSPVNPWPMNPVQPWRPYDVDNSIACYICGIRGGMLSFVCNDPSCPSKVVYCSAK